MPSSPRSYRQRHSNTNLRFINRVRVEGRLHSIDDEVIVVATINSIYSILTFKGRIVEIYQILLNGIWKVIVVVESDYLSVGNRYRCWLRQLRSVHNIEYI